MGKNLENCVYKTEKKRERERTNQITTGIKTERKGVLEKNGGNGRNFGISTFILIPELDHSLIKKETIRAW